MYLLYADESGTPGGTGQKYFILAGVVVFERNTYSLSRNLDRIAATFNNDAAEDVELHGSPMYGGRSGWRKQPKVKRHDAIKEALQLINGKNCRIIASVMHKDKVVRGNDPVYHTFQQVVSRFDHFLARQHRHYNNMQRGLVIFDKSQKEIPIQKLAAEFEKDGHKWGKLRNMAEVPVFIDSKATRLVQLADLVAYSLFRKYEHGDDEFYKIIEDQFDSFGGVRHGLHEHV